jgi:hypothetical protein
MAGIRRLAYCLNLLIRTFQSHPGDWASLYRDIPIGDLFRIRTCRHPDLIVVGGGGDCCGYGLSPMPSIGSGSGIMAVGFYPDNFGEGIGSRKSAIGSSVGNQNAYECYSIFMGLSFPILIVSPMAAFGKRYTMFASWPAFRVIR